MAVGPLDRRGERSHRYVIGRHSALRVLLRAHGLEAWLMPPPATADDPTLGLVADTAAVMMLRRRRTLDRFLLGTLEARKRVMLKSTHAYPV
jgi:hypothetical protein